MVAVWITVLVCFYSWSELSKADDETPTISPTPPTDGNASAVGLLRGMTVAHHSDALSKGRTQEYTKVKGDLLTSSYPREITYGSSDIKNKLAVNIKESRSKEKENNKFAYNVLSTDSLRQNKSSLRNTRKLDQKYQPNFVMPDVNQNSLFASNLEPRLPIKNELANSTKFKNELPNINFKNCVNNHLECSENKIILIKHDRLEDKSQENIVDKRKNMLSVLGVMNGKFKNQSKKSENMLDALNESDGLIKSSNLKVIEKTKLRENEINIDNLYGDLKTQLIDIKDEYSYANNYEANEKQRKIFLDSLVDLKDLETDEENRKENDILIRTRRQNNLQFLTDIDNINNRSKEQHKLCWTETVTVTTNIKTNISENSHEIIKEYGVVWERPVGEENSSPVSLEKKINDAKETLSRENMNENYLSSNERELLSNSSKKMVKYKIISSNPNQTVEQIETTYCKTGNRIDVETITNNKRKNQRTKFNILPKEKTIIHSNNDSDIFEPSLESQLDLHVKRTRSINLSEAGDTNLKPNKLFEKVRFDYGTFNIPEHSQNQDVAIPNKVREMLGSKSILTHWHPTEKAKTTASYETGEDSSYYDGDHEDYDYYSDYTDYFDESHFNKTMNSKINKVENVSQIKNKKGKISKGSVEDIASIEQSSDEAEEYESGSLKQTENIDHVILESLTSVRPSKNIISNDDNHKHPMVLDAQTSPKNDNAKSMNKTISLESINHKSSQEDYTVKNKTEGIYLETETLTSKIITETYTKIPIVEGISLRSDLATNDSKISPTIKQINLKLKMSTSTPHVTYTEKKPGTTLLDSSKNYDSTINSNEKRSFELTTHSKIPQETSERGNILKNTILPSGRSAYGSTTENTTGQVLIKSTIIFDKVHKISEENSTQQMMELTTEPHTSQIDTDKENTSINIVLESAMRSYKTRDSSTKENLSLGSDTHEISNITSKMYIDKAHKIPTKNVTGEEIMQSGLYSNTLNEISLKDNVNESINIEQITSFYTINDLISTEISTKLLPLNKYTNILNDSSESENVNGLISLESATYLDKSQESLLTENPIEDILESQTTSDILFDTSTKENIFGHISLESDKLTDNSYETMGKSSDVSTSKIKTGNESLGDSSLYLDNDPHFERSDLEKELRANSTHSSSLESKGIDDTYKITNTSDDSNNEISEFGDFSHSSETNSMGKAADDIVLSQDDINDISLSTENNPFDITSEPDTDTNIYDKETYTEKSSTHIPGYQLISSSDEVSYTEKENIHKPGLVEYENNSENIDENYTAEGLDENISLESATLLDKYLDKKEDTTVNASTKYSTVSKLATVHYNLTSLNDSIIIENLGILKLTTDKPISNTSSSFLGSTNLIENTIEPAERSNIDNEMLEFTTLKSLPVELALNGTIDSLFLDSTVMNDKNTEKRIGGMTMENTSNLDKLLKNNEDPFDKNNNTELLFGLLNDSQDIMKVSTKNNKNESLENAKSTVVVNTENLESKSTTQSKLTGTTQDKLFTYNASLESADLLVTTIKTSIENLSFYSSLDYTTSPGKLVGSGVETLLEDVSMESVARSKTAREPTNKIIEATKMKVMNEELATETSPINTYFKSTRLPTKKAKNKISFDNLNSEFSTLSAQETSPMRNKRPDVKVSFENIALGTSSLSQNKGESKVETSTQNVLRQFSAPLVMNNQSETETSTTKVLSDFTTTLRNNSTPLVEIPTKSELIELDSTSRNTNIETTETFKENVSIKPSTSLENTSLALLETSNSSVPIELLTPSRMTEHSPIEALNINSALELSSPLGNSIIPEVEKSTENVSLEFSTLSGETSISLKYAVTESLIVQSDKLLGNNSIPSVNKFTENVGRESSTLLGVIGQLVIETSNANISIESSTLSEKISMAAEETSDGNVLFESTKLSGKTDLKSVEISNSNMSMATFIHSEMTEQSSKELPNTKAIELSRPLGNTIIPPKVDKYSENLSSDHALLSVNTLMPLVDTLSKDISINFATLSGNTIISPIESFTENISNDFITSSEYTSMPPVEISNSNISMESAILLGITEQSEIYNSNIPFKSSKLLENSIISKGETVTVNVSLESATLSGNITMPSVKSFTETVLIVNSASLGITEQSPINSSIENLLLESFTLSEKSIITDKKPYDENMLLESVTLSGINNKSSLETFSEIISIDFATLSENTKFASVETSTKEKLTESYTPAEVAVQSAIKSSNANFLLDNFTLSDNSTIHGEEISNGNILLESATSSGITIMPSVEMFAERISTESLPLLGNTNILPRETLIENLSFNSSTISEITNMPQEEILTAIIANHYTLSDYSSTSLVETPSTNLSIDSPTLSGISGQSAFNTSNGYVELEYSKREGISISPVNISKANASFVSSTLSRIATETLEEVSNMNISFESTRQSTISMIPSFEKSSSNVYLEYGTLSGMSGDSPIEISTFGLSLGLATHPRTNTNISLEIPIVNISLETSTSFGLFENPPKDLSTQNLSLEFVKPTIKTEQTLLETSTVNLPLENTTLFEVLNETSKEKSRLNKSLETVTLRGISGEKGIETTFTKPLEFTKILGASTDTSLYNTNASLPLKSKKQLKLNSDTLKETSTESVTKESATLLGMTQEPLKEKSIPTESLELVTVIGTTRAPSVEITTGNVSLESSTLVGMTREPLKEKYIPTESLELVTVMGLTREPSVEITTGNVSLESATLLGMTREPLKETYLIKSVDFHTISEDVKEPLVHIHSVNEPMENVKILNITREPSVESSSLENEKNSTITKYELNTDTLYKTNEISSVENFSLNVSLESATKYQMVEDSVTDTSTINSLLKSDSLPGKTSVYLEEHSGENVSLVNPTLLETTSVYIKEPFIKNISFESVNQSITTRKPKIKTTDKPVFLEYSPSLVVREKSAIENTTENISFDYAFSPFSIKETEREITSQNVSLNPITLEDRTEISEIKSTSQSVSLEFVPQIASKGVTEIIPTTQQVPLEYVPFKTKSGELQLKPITQLPSLESISSTFTTEESEIKTTTENLPLKLATLSVTTRESNIKHTTQNIPFESSTLSVTRGESKTKPYTQNTLWESSTLAITTDVSEIENTTQNVSLEFVTLAITTEQSEIETTIKYSPLESVPLIVKTGISEIQSTTQDVHLESIPLSIKAEISEIEPSTQRSLSLTFTPRVSETEHTAQNESLKSLPITYTTEMLEIEPTTRTVPLEAVTFSATADLSEIEITTETVYLESITLAITTEESEIETTYKDSTLEYVPLIVKTGISEMQSTTQDVQLESTTLSDKAEISEIEPTNQKSFLKNVTLTPIVSVTEHTAKNESLKSLPITYTTEILKLEPTTQIVPLELVTLTATTDFSEIELTTETVSLESVPLIAMTGTSELEPTTQSVTLEPLALTSMTVFLKGEQNILAVSKESDPLTVMTEVSKIESISTNVSLESVSLNAITGVSEIDQATQDESLESFPLSVNTGISAIEPTTQDASWESSTLMETTKESEIETINQNLSFESDNLPVMTKESDIQPGTQNVDFDSSTLSFKTAESEIKSNTQNIYLESVSLSATTRESEIKPLSKNVSIESVNLTQPTGESLVNSYTQNVYNDAATLSLPTLGSLTEYSTEKLHFGAINLPQIKENVSLEISPLIKNSKYDNQIKMTAMSAQEISPPNVLLEYNNIKNKTKESSLKSSTKNIYLESLNSSEKTKDLGIETSFDNVDLLSENQTEIVEESSVGNYLTSIGLEYASSYGNTGVEISTVNESLENNNLTVDWSLETSSFSVEALTGESALETSTSNVLWDSSTLSRTGDLSVETTILNRALESTTINWKTYSSTGSFNTGESLETTTLTDIAGEPAVDTSIKNDSSEYATITQIKEASTVETHSSSDVYWDSTTFQSMTEYSTVDLSSPNVTLESATLSAITYVALELESKVTKNNSLSSNNNSTLNWDLVSETSTKYFTSDNSTSLEINGSVMKENIPKNLYLQSKTNSELTEEVFTDSAMLDFTNLLLSPEKTKFGYTKENYTSRYSTFSQSNNQTTTKHDIVRSKNVHTVTTAKPVLDRVSESFTYPTVNVQEVSKFESLGLVTITPIHSKGNTTRIPLFNQVLLLNISNDQKIYMKEPTSDQLSLESEAIFVSKIENITHIDKVTRPTLVYGKLILPETILEPITLIEPVTFKNSNIQDISKISLVDGQVLHEPLKILNVNYFENSSAGLLNDTKLIESVANPKTNFKETQTVKSKFKQGIGSAIFTTSSNHETSPVESIFDRKSLVSANNSSNSALKSFLEEPLKDKIGHTKYKDYPKLNNFNVNLFNDDSFRNKNNIGEYYQKPINFTKGIKVEKQKEIPEQINSISTFDQYLEHSNHTFSTNKTSVESLSELIHDGSINLPPKLQDYTAIQPFSEPLYSAFDNNYIPKITKKHKNKLIFGSQNLSREADDYNKNQLIDHEINLNYTITGENISDSHVKQSLFDQIMSKWENAQSKEVLKGVSYLDTNKPHVTVSEANNNIITNKSSINKTQNIEINIMPRSRHKEVESEDKNEITKLPELIFGLPTIDIDPIYKNTFNGENKYKTFYVPTVKENYTLLLENTSQTFNSVNNLNSSLLDQNFQTDNVMSIYGSTKPISDEVTYTDSREDYLTTTEFAIDYKSSTESNEASDEFYDSTTEDVSYGYIFSEEFTTTEISTHDHESTEINFDESISEESTKNYFTTTEYSTESEEDTNEIANQRMIGSRYFQHSYNLSSFLSTTILEDSTRNENIDEINTKEDERKSDEKDNTEITITELYNRNYEELGTEEIVTTNTGHMGENINQVDLNDNSEWTTTLDSVWNIWTKEPITIKTRPSDDIIPDVEINHPKDNIEKSQSIEMTTLEIIPAKRKFGDKNIISRISLNNDVNNNKMHKEYNGSSEQSSEEEPSIESLKNLETGVYEPNIEIGSLKLYLSSSEKYSDTNKDENLVGMEKQMNDLKKPKDKSILIENKYETKPSTLKYSEERIIKGGKIQSDVPENLPLAPYLHFNKTTKEISNISQFNKKTSGLNHLDFTIDPVERSRLIKLESSLSDYTEPLQTTEAISNKKLSDFGEFRGLHSTNIYPIHRSKSSPIFPSTELEYGLITEKKTDSKYPYLNIYTTPYFSITENIASNLNPSVSFISTQNNKTTKSINHNTLNEHKAHIYQNIPRSLQTEYVNREMNNYETTPMTKLYNTGENKMYSTKETLENIERENYSKNRPGFLPKESIVLSPNNSEQISILLPNKYKVDSNISSYSRDEYENKTIPVSTTFYGSGEVNANIPCTDAQNIHHNIESPTIGTRNAGFNLKLNEIERNTLQERKYTAEGQLETLNSKTNLTLQQLMQIFHSKPDIDKEILRHNNLTNNLTVKQILNILYSKVKETAQNQQKYIENKTKEGAPMFEHSSISKARSEISIKQTMQGSKNQFVEIYKDTPRKKKPITELVNCIEKGKNDFEFDYSFDQYDDSSSDKSNQNNREEQIERDILCQVPPEDLNKFERDNEHLKKNSDNTGDDIDISQFYDDDRELSYDSEYGIYDDESHKEDYRRMADISNIEGYQIGNQKNMNDYPIIMSNRIRMPKPFDSNLGQILEDNEHNIGNIDYVSDPTIFYYHTTYKDKNQRFTPYDYARYFEVGPQKYTHGKSSNARYNRYENRGINNINAPNNFHSNLETHFSREKYRNSLLRRRPIRRKYQTTFSKINMLSQNMKYAPSEEYTKILPRVTLTKLKRRNPTFIRIPYLLLRNEYLRDTAKSPTHRNNNYYMNTNHSSEKLRNNGTINFHKNSRILKNRRKIKRKQINGDYSADNVLNLESSILFYPNSETENNSFEYNGLNIGNTQSTYDNEYLEETHNLKQSVLPYINKELENKSIDHGEPFSEIENIDYGKNINNQRNKLENISNYFRNRIEGKPTPSEQPNIAKRQNDDHAELLYERLSSLNPQYSDEVNPNKYSYPDKQSILNHPDTPYTKPNLEMVLPFSSEMSAYVDYENARTIPHTKFDLSNEKSTHLVKVMKPFSKEEESNEFYETQKPIKGKYPQFNSMLNSKETVLENINNPYSKVTKHEPFENHDSSIENINGKNYTRMLKRVMLPSAQDVINNEYSEYEEPPEEIFY